jgi:hypothetical protein
VGLLSVGAGGKGVVCWQCKGLVGSFPFVFLCGCGGGLLCVSLQGLGGGGVPLQQGVRR